MFPVMTTTELTRCSLIFLAARITGSEGDTTGTLLFSVMIVDKEGLNICSRRDSMNACGPGKSFPH
uniref:Uncharacterized protein n=1 Tax=Arundo donax TaxID=35708 RepID=A0A0A9EQK7_ARUDO